MKKLLSLKAVLFALAVLLLAGIAFAPTGARAGDGNENAEVTPTPAATAEWEYNATTDTLTFNPAEGGKIYYVSGKKATFKAKDSAIKNVSASTDIVVNDKTNGFNIKAGKDAYVYYSTSAISAGSITANITLKGQTDKIKAVTIDYYKAIPEAAVVDDALKNASVLTVTKGKDATVVSIGAVNVKFDEEWVEGSKFTAKDLYAMISGTEKKTIYVRLAGTNASKAGGEAVRPSAEKKVKVALQKAGKAVKVDYAKGTIALKNGFDYFVDSTGTAEIPEASIATEAFEKKVISILPYNKQGTAASTTAIFTDYLNGTYKLVAKPSGEDLAYYTATKVKSLGIEQYGFWYVRKSATAKAPAQKWASAGKIAEPDKAPTIDISKVKVTSKGAIEVGNTADLEFIILSKAQFNEGDVKVDVATLKWNKLKTGKSFKKTVKTKIDKTTTNTYAADNYILIRTPGTKGSKLPSKYAAFKIVSDGKWEAFEEKSEETTEEPTPTPEP